MGGSSLRFGEVLREERFTGFSDSYIFFAGGVRYGRWSFLAIWFYLFARCLFAFWGLRRGGVLRRRYSVFFHGHLVFFFMVFFFHGG